MNRHAMRQLIVQTLYHIEVGTGTKLEATQSILEFVENLKNGAIENPEIAVEEAVLEAEFTIEAFYFTTLEGIIDNLEKIDALISAHLQGWTLARLNKVDKAILRLAVYEIVVDRTPIKVAINEALELTKSFTDVGDKKAAKFNNKVLDDIGRTLMESGF